MMDVAQDDSLCHKALAISAPLKTSLIGYKPVQAVEKLITNFFPHFTWNYCFKALLQAGLKVFALHLPLHLALHI